MYWFMKKFYLLIVFILSLSCGVSAQNGIIGAGFSTGWANPANITSFLASAGTSRIATRNPSGTGDQFFRLVRNWSGNNTEFGPFGCTNTNWSAEAGISYNNMPTCGSGAFYINCPNISDNYIFKTKTGDLDDDFVYFRVQGTVQTVSTVTRNFTTVSTGQNIVVTATLSGALATGQGVYLRYTNNNYSASTIVAMSGSGTTYTATIPAGTNTTGANISYYVFTSGNGLTILHADADYYTINLNNNSNSNYSYTVISGNTTAQNGLWNVGSTWTSGSVPATDANVIINHLVTLNVNVSVTDIALNSTLTSESGQARQLTIKGNLTNNGTFTADNGTVSLSSAGTRQILGTAVTTFNNIETSTTVDFVDASTNRGTINGTFTIKSGGNVLTTSAPVYATGSTLKFDTGGSYYAGEAWYSNNPSGSAGVPKNVTITNGTTLNFGSDNTYRQMDGNLIIETGATFTLSSVGFGDLRLQGNFTNNGTFNQNSRGTFFNGSIEQTISHTSSGTLTFGYFIIDKPTATNVKLLSNININGSGGIGAAFEIKNTGGFDLNDRTATYNNNGTNFISVTGSNRTVSNSGAGEGVFEILAGNSGSNIQCSLSNTGSGNLIFATKTKLSIKGTPPGSGYCILKINGDILTIQNVFEINNRGALELTGNSPIYASGSILRYNSTDEYIRTKEWNTNSGAGYPHHVEIKNNTFFCIGGNSGLNTARTIGGNMTIESGSTFILADKQILPAYMTAALTITGNVNNAGTLNLSNSVGGDLNVLGNFVNSGTFNASARTVTMNGTSAQVIQADASTTFFNLTLNKTAGTAQLAGSQSGINVTNLLKINGTNTADLDLNFRNVNLGTTGTMLENRAGNVIITDNTSGLTDYNKGGSVIFTSRTIPVALVGGDGIAGSGIDLNVGGATPISNLSITRYHYRGGSLSYNAGIKKIYKLSADAFGGNTVTLRIYYATQEVINGITVNKVYRWSGSVAPLAWNKYETGEVVGADNVLVNGLLNFSHWTLGQANLPLPASLLSFVGKKISDTKSQLDWQTASEINNQGFYIEKSYDAQNFETIGFVAGAGNSPTLKTYRFVDDAFLFSAYYRLRQVDLNGNLAYSPIIWIENGVFRLYPNPIVKDVMLQIPVEANTKVELVLYDMLGRQVCSLPTTAKNSSQILSQKLASLPAGAYVLRVRAGVKQWTEKIIKL